jgi:hypothetical protein
MDQEHRATRESRSGSCASAREEQSCSCREWFRRRHIIAAENRKERAELHQKVLATLALCPPAQGQTNTILQVRYNRGCGRWEPISRTRERAYGFLVALTMVTVLMGIGEIATYYGIAALYGFHRIW